MTNQTLGSRIKTARTRAGLSQAALGKVFGISREAVSAWESDTNAPTADKLGRIAQETSVRAEWLITGTGEMDGEAPPPPSHPLDMAGQVQMTLGEIPLMGTAEGGPDGLVEWNGEVVGTVARPPFLAGAKGAYGVYVTGQSMEKRYFAGELVYVHPGRPILPGVFVVVQFYKDNAGGTPCAWVKQFVSRNDKTTVFRQFNPEKELKIPTQTILSVHRIVGTGEF